MHEPDAFEGFVDGFARQDAAQCLVFFGWVPRECVTLEKWVFNVVFERGAVSGPVLVAFHDRPDLGGLGIGFVALLSAGPVNLGGLLHVELGPYKLTLAEGTADDVQKFSDQAIVEQAISTLSTCFGQPVILQIRTLLARRFVGEGYIDAYGYHVPSASWFVTGWISNGWIDSVTHRVEALAQFDGTRCTGTPVLNFFDRPDLRDKGKGVILQIVLDEPVRGQLLNLALVSGEATVNLRPADRMTCIPSEALAGRLVKLINDSEPTLSRQKLEDIISHGNFEGRDPGRKLPDKMADFLTQLISRRPAASSVAAHDAFEGRDPGRKLPDKMADFLTQLISRRATASSFAARGAAVGAATDNLGPVQRDDTAEADQFDETEIRYSDEEAMTYIAEAGLFLADYYLATYPDVAEAEIDPLHHFFHYGFREGRQPNPYFEPLWYLDNNPDVKAAETQPLLHYAVLGEKQGRRPSPVFDPTWYRAHYEIALDQLALAHYLANRTSARFSPLPDFDVDFYATKNADVAAAGIDLFYHFINYGYLELRSPSAAFDVKFYSQRYLSRDTGKNPFLHYLAHKGEPGVFGRMPDEETTVWREVKRFTKPGPTFEHFRPLPPSAARQFKLLVYYLPQFHAIAENDAWWGKGFTEWTNIARGVPRFKGHYQPRIPRDLGFYSLDSVEPIRQQAAMAQAAGVHGFVFYYYWFNGERLLEKPLARFLDDRSIDMPFSLMWANENWTRRWDGSESEVLISQDYRPDDDEAMAAEFARHFKDPRYIRVQGRPLLMIYRPRLIPEATKTIGRWREIFKSQHGEDPILLMAQSFMDADPTPYGIDGAIEFPPHKLTQHMPPINAEIEYLDPEFTGNIYSYDEVVRTSLSEPPPAFPLIKTAVPSWDNDARRQGAGLTITNSSPAKYEDWLSCLGDFARRNPFFGEPIVCVNAWNEWCEGAYLEPDLHFGSAYLNATARAVTGLSRVRSMTAPRLLLIGHDAFPGGAQQNLLSQGRVLRRNFGADIEFLLLDGGKLEDEYSQVAPLTLAPAESVFRLKLTVLAEQGFRHAIINTTAASHVLPLLRLAGIEAIVLVHELPHIIREKHLIVGARAALTARQVVFAAPFVRDALLTALGIEATDRAVILPQGSYKNIVYNPEAAARFNAEFGLTNRDKLVIGAGYADMRKGFDLFLQLWRQLRTANAATNKRCGRTVLMWIGGMDPGLKDWLGTEIADAEATDTFHMAGYRDDMDAVFSAADAFALTSREDPFPTVVLEALSAGLPVTAFDRAGGIPDMLRETNQGAVVPYGDVTAMAAAIAKQLTSGITERQRADRQALVAERFSFKTYVRHLLDLAIPNLPSISVVVPNYNYARYMPERLGSVFAQSHPVHEIIVLDDASTDDSATVIPALAAAWDREICFVPNQVNSGSVFAQWRKAAEQATGTFVWLAEADDAAERDFLHCTLALLASDPSIQFAFTDSRTIDSDGKPQSPSYKPYYSTVTPGALAVTEIFAAEDFVRRMLSVKNLILNVSGVVWRRDALVRALMACEAELATFRMAGDWRLYLEALALPGAKVAYEAKPLNVHRRHATSVTHALDADRHVTEIARCHAVARQFFTLPKSVCTRQAAYVAQVTQQLGAKNATPAKLTCSAAGKATLPPRSGRKGAGR